MLLGGVRHVPYLKFERFGDDFILDKMDLECKMQAYVN